ncbi:restriction endonuclease subunit S [Chryseobacterium aquaticum]|uniref:restriction endonuclease subunit S n=1 Tax=Chryseobacterium aquaticum TaxID=452084 RepID=UPI002FC98757
MVKENVMKQTEIGLLPEDWSLEILSTVSLLKGRIGWQGLNQSEFTDNDNQPFLITGMNFKDGKIRWNEVYHVSDERYEIAKDIQLKNDDVLMTKDGTIGKMLYVDNIPYPFKASLNSHLLLFRPKNNKYIPKYLYYNLQFKYFLNHIEENKSGTTFFGLSQSSVGKYKIPLPPLPEQEAIAEALSDADAWIESLEQLIVKKRFIKQGAMQELLSPKEDWEVKKLGEVATISGGGTPSTFVSEYWNGDIEWFTPTEVGYDKYLYSSKRKITNTGLKNSSATILPVNTILLTSRAGIGDLGILKIEASTNQGFQSIICKEAVDVEFIYYLMSTKKEDLLKNASGSTFLEISPNKVKSLEIIIPSLAEQTRIATILSDMDAELEALEGQLGKARKVKQGMMQELLTGRVRLV